MVIAVMCIIYNYLPWFKLADASLNVMSIIWNLHSPVKIKGLHETKGRRKREYWIEFRVYVVQLVDEDLEKLTDKLTQILAKSHPDLSSYELFLESESYKHMII